VSSDLKKPPVMSIYCSTLRRVLICIYLALICLFFPLNGPDEGATAASRGRLKKTIVIDPGHGGHETGAKSSAGTQEKAVALSLARLIESELKGKYRVILTRTDDYGLEVPQRADIANHAKANVFISIHAGGSFEHQAGGITIYYFKETSGSISPDKKSEGRAGLDDDPILWDRLQQKHVTSSRRLAERLRKHISQQINFMPCRITTAPLLVLRGADMPAVLIEAGYLTNPDNEKYLSNEKDLRKIARAMTAGIEDFIRRDLR
jgi:N-acetylmuramoyl-L-alanine amidase